MRLLLFFMLISFSLSEACANSLPQNFVLKGAIAARTVNDGWSAFLQWQQNGGNYVITLIGPLSSQSAVLYGSPRSVQLATSDGKRFTANSAEELLIKQTGWNLPVSNLYYWIRGVEVPNIPAEKSFDSYHHLTKLYQQGWQVQFLNYISINQIALPRKILLYHPQLNIKIVINQWQI